MRRDIFCLKSLTFYFYLDFFFLVFFLRHNLLALFHCISLRMICFLIEDCELFT